MSSLYPTPKTFDQRAADDAERRQRQRVRLPKLPWLTLPLFGGVVAWGVLQFMRIVPEMWSVGSSAFIFFTFAMWLGCVGLYAWWAVYAHKVIYAHGRSVLVFWLGYMALLSAVLAVHATKMLPDIKGADYINLVAVVYVVLLFLWVCAVLLLGRKKIIKKK